MHSDTENLLIPCDGGGPTDPAGVDPQTAPPRRRRELDGLERMAGALRNLPQLTPPPAIWDRVIAEVDAGPARPRVPEWKFAATGAVAAALLGALGLVSLLRTGAPPVATQAARDETAGAARLPVEAEAAPRPAAYESLRAESALLERSLEQMGNRPRILHAGTADTIARLEDTIFLLDQQLSVAAAAGDMDRNQQEALWRERVDVMNALVQVQYAASDDPTF